jgi:hypothetical protein
VIDRRCFCDSEVEENVEVVGHADGEWRALCLRVLDGLKRWSARLMDKTSSGGRILRTGRGGSQKKEKLGL